MGGFISPYRGWYLFIEFSLPKDPLFVALGFQNPSGLLSEEIF